MGEGEGSVGLDYGIRVGVGDGWKQDGCVGDWMGLGLDGVEIGMGKRVRVGWYNKIRS